MKLALCHQEEMGDWFTIERAAHENRYWIQQRGDHSECMYSGRVSDADVEGTWEEMQEISAAIEQRSEVRFKRCAVHVEGARVFFFSPRNSRTNGECTLAEADELAALIRAEPRPTEDS